MESKMTNGAVTAAPASSMMVHYGSGGSDATQTIALPPDVRVVTLETGGRFRAAARSAGVRS